MNKNPLFIPTERKAVDGSGQIGCLYNLDSDSIVRRVNITHKAQVSQSEEPVHCEIIYGNIDKNKNLLQMIGIQGDLRLKILLKLIPRSGLASIINHPYSINDNTRIVYFSYENKKEQLPEYIVRDAIRYEHPGKTATHLINAVSWGIEIVLILQLLSTKKSITEIESILEKVRCILNGSLQISSLTPDDEIVLQQNTDITVYSNISQLDRMISIRRICEFINTRPANYTVFRPLMYTLEPLELRLPKDSRLDVPCHQLETVYNHNSERCLLKYLDTLKVLKYSLDYDVKSMLNGHLERQLQEVQQEWVQFQSLIFDIIHGSCDISIIDKEIKQNQGIIEDTIHRLTEDLNKLKAKARLIADLIKKKFHYINVLEYNIDRKDNDASIRQKLASNDQHRLILYSNDDLNKQNTQKCHKLQKTMIEEHKRNSTLCLIYADFSYCSFQLSDMRVLRLDRANKMNIGANKDEILSATTDTINVLFLGETGIGKSTFINALANYLTFHTLEEARTTQPVVLIPVSFLITTGDDFQEHIIKFGEVDDSNNEDFDHPGQSVTQHCKSYLFHLKNNHGKKLRIIDTPGFGDTRGIQQDDQNIQHILQYINNLSHLNAICFLLKPNESRLNIFFRSCFTQLFSFLNQKALKNIIFCFTNSRSTFYTPGNTAPLLKKMISSLSIGDVPFNKENTFCFDNEAFRYLVALQNGIRFSDEENNEYEKSWSISVTQSHHLINHIDRKMSRYRMNSGHESMKRVELEIIEMIRPMLEAMRNILRNRILQEMDSENGSLGLYAKVISPPATICLSCAPYPLRVRQVWIPEKIPHRIRNNSCSCKCSLDQHMPIDYILQYKFSETEKISQDSLTKFQRMLCYNSAELSLFLTHSIGFEKNDPFLTGFVQMINEEKYILENQRPNTLNSTLVDDICKLQTEYKRHLHELQRKQKPKEPFEMYNILNTIRECPMVHKQMIVVKEAQQTMMTMYECKVPKQSTEFTDFYSSIF